MKSLPERFWQAFLLTKRLLAQRDFLVGGGKVENLPL
jgi:hypothetical protein